MWSLILLVGSATAIGSAYEGSVWGMEPGLIAMDNFLPQTFDLKPEGAWLIPLVKKDLELAGKLKPFVRSQYMGNSNYRVKDVLDLYRQHNFTHYVGFIQRGTDRYKDAIKVYDDITLNKMDDFFEELVQAMYCNDEYHVSYFLLHYLHLRAGLGLARIAVRKLYPNCEKFAQIPEVKKFYMQHRGENPRSLTTLKEFSELINWLKFEGKLKIEGKSLTAAFHRANHNVPQ
ncbi:hypothetical protein QR680_014775 [Steinernema hermaphroditum]|uniref:Hemocyanin N-terminal domain-containing protein n=1 Tax=Steinernema hermaphroditum TaxID=289476 RepID=A0AA39M3S8_9BILA|nr:hypothetical protein QR680_014775 [Steinernema hermaphroditum]